MYARCGELEQAKAYSTELKRRGLADVVSVHRVDQRLARAGKVTEAMAVLDEGTARKMQWNDRTFCALLVACGEAGELELGKRVHQIALDHKVAKASKFLSALLDMYARCGELEQAKGCVRMKRSGAAWLMWSPTP